METKGYLLALVIILLATKLMGLMTERMRMPQIVGALLAGLLILVTAYLVDGSFNPFLYFRF